MFADLMSVLRIFFGKFQEPPDALLVIVVFLAFYNNLEKKTEY
jgi:hypothetical protein